LPLNTIVCSLHVVAGIAVVFNGKNRIAIVTGTADFALAHIIHAEIRIFAVYDIKDLVVAEITFLAGHLNDHIYDIIDPADPGKFQKELG